MLKEELEVLAGKDFATDLDLNAQAIQAKDKGFTEPQVHENLMNGKKLPLASRNKQKTVVIMRDEKGSVQGEKGTEPRK